ncbi:uncharacterized protein HMPREF1541_10835 [Cyphellophora europaea CBS 101466]|uniref:Uncharacterized protein n=1 Tax=Cyphellophora europaea (strain CBS 101466) TaxID=1220924 RepID=W2S5T5_CYPE1|nr:uncharacterized protein HMPREF1541_10835 [Cyphellophora europaea CBS 101466]ETN43970.1 hypothetical protein HMPREF1541_10835 [Cyphellophora europaea CBS 101466]
MAFQPKPFSEVTKSAIASSFVPGVTLPANRHQGTLQKASLAQQVGDTFDDILDSLCDLEGDDEVELRVEMGDSGMDNEVVLGGMDDESDSGYESDDSQSPYISSDCSHRACFQGSSVCRVKGKASQREGSHLPAVKDLDMIDAEAKRAVTPDKPTDVQVDDMEWEST